MATLKKLTRVGADVRQIARLLQAKAPEGHMLAYITPEEADLLKSRGGSGKEHEDTGVPSFEMEDSGGFDTAAFEGVEPTSQITQPITQGQVNAPSFGGGIDLGYQPGTTPSEKPIDLGQAAPAPEPQATPTYTGDMGQYAGAFPAGSFETQPGPSGPAYQIDTTPPKTMGQRFGDLASSLGIKEDTLGKLGVGGLQAILGAYQANKAAEQGQAAKKEQQALAAPYQQKGAELQRAAQAGELTPQSQQALQAVQAQAAQQASARGGAVGQAQMQAQIEAFRQQLLQQQYDYGLKLSGIGDQIALGAIKTGMQADQYVNQLTSSYYNNIARTLYGAPPAQQTQTGATYG